MSWWAADRCQFKSAEIGIESDIHSKLLVNATTRLSYVMQHELLSP